MGKYFLSEQFNEIELIKGYDYLYLVFNRGLG